MRRTSLGRGSSQFLLGKNARGRTITLEGDFLGLLLLGTLAFWCRTHGRQLQGNTLLTGGFLVCLSLKSTLDGHFATFTHETLLQLDVVVRWSRSGWHIRRNIHRRELCRLKSCMNLTW